MNTQGSILPRIVAEERMVPPEWALQEQWLFATLNQAAKEFVARYTQPDGSLIWQKEWPGMDGSDDPYEGFMNLALLYVLGGSRELHEVSRKIWEGITWQWTEYGQIQREFDAYYDWMHHGEGYLFLYFLGLAGPVTTKDKQRALRFASMYMGDDPEAPNYDKAQKLIRSPLTGSKGPRFTVSEEDWVTHRSILDHYPAPYEDIPGVDFASGKCPWSNDDVYQSLIAMMNERMNRGDVPLNLNATGLITHAFMHNGDTVYRDWVVDYLAAWEERTRHNGGVIPDNVGLSGVIGEYNEGKWWGGYYGWRWPHGFMTIIEPLTNACMNAVLLTGDMNQLELARSQLDANWALRREENGQVLVPNKHRDNGWYDWRKALPKYPVYLWTMSMADEDLERIDRIPKDHDWNEITVPVVSGRDSRTGRETKHYIGNTEPWFQYIRGFNPDYPKRILAANMELVGRQLERMRSEEGDPHGWKSGFADGDFSNIHIWQEMCPIYFESLVQLTLGGPMHISHGGLQHARVRYFDSQERRPGLPLGVSALVEALTTDGVTLQLCNTSLYDEREVVIQAGGFGEHEFTSAERIDAEGCPVQGSHMELKGKWLTIHLKQGTGIRLRLGMKRYVNSPSYEMPWPNPYAADVLTGRKGQEGEAPCT
ncbi:hypothetical protein GC096_21340 [Paenibacillus sp. LMG 31461]|uniref:Linalool dehydratase/isomerase domain-containing protein n=1 Tax=Paenibacillus plantarum TaxID=2654975 RepID=A0ABX1XDM5_9BACL|nr:hypothetical protein [Paenibacillus plantarum]NOU66592.1 hypothetical protein [Paenibacillus plantarum]